MILRIPARVARRAEAAGEGGRAWLAGLEALVEALCAEWGLTFGEALGGGTEAFVAAVTTRDGRPAVLKLALDGAAFEAELHTLLAAEGQGYAEVLAHDLRRGAVLMERLGPQLAELGLPVDAQIGHICATLRDAWRELPRGIAVMDGAAKARHLAALVEGARREAGERTVAFALRCAEMRERAFDPARAVLAHGDAHAWNTLAVPGGTGFKLVDPDGVFVEPEYDLAIPMREWSAELLAGDTVALARARCAALAALTGLDPHAIWQWGFLERVSTGLLGLQLGIAEGAEMLAVADRIAAAE